MSTINIDAETYYINTYLGQEKKEIVTNKLLFEMISSLNFCKKENTSLNLRKYTYWEDFNFNAPDSNRD